MSPQHALNTSFMNYRINPLFLNYSFSATKYINLICTEKNPLIDIIL